MSVLLDCKQSNTYPRQCEVEEVGKRAEGYAHSQDGSCLDLEGDTVLEGSSRGTAIYDFLGEEGLHMLCSDTIGLESDGLVRQLWLIAGDTREILVHAIDGLQDQVEREVGARPREDNILFLQ